jgi:hypothetical protein
VRHFSDEVSETPEIQRETSLEARERPFCSKNGSSARGLQADGITTSKGSLCSISRMASRKPSRFDARHNSKRENVTFAAETNFPPGDCRQMTSQLPKHVCATFLGWGSRKLSRFDARQVSKRPSVVFAAKMAFPPEGCRQVPSQLPKEVPATFLG